MEDIIYRKKGEPSPKHKVIKGISMKLIMKSGTMEVLKIEMEKGASFGTSFEHRGEEFHYVISGVVEYQVEDSVYRLEAGDSLWHKSRLRHTARNVGDDKAVFIDVITPPSFM